jgi:gliding motility-associated lipoprotein GldH
MKLVLKYALFILTVLLLSVVLFSCDPNKRFESFENLKDMQWDIHQPVSFQTTITDTTEACNVIVQVRHTPQYPFQNLYLFLTTEYPDGNRSRDSLMFYLFQPDGKPMGKCLGDYCDASFLFRQNVRFPMRGPYTFQLEHTMRTKDGILPMILGVGMRIEKATDKAS